MGTTQWHFERTGNGAVFVLDAPDPSGGEGCRVGLKLEMTEEEFSRLTRQLDRVLCFSAGSADGVFTAPFTPEEARGQLTIERYLVTARSPEVAQAMQEATPWANWVEAVPAAKGFTWLVSSFAVDRLEFLQVARSAGVTVQHLMASTQPDPLAPVIEGDKADAWSPRSADRAALNGSG